MGEYSFVKPIYRSKANITGAAGLGTQGAAEDSSGESLKDTVFVRPRSLTRARVGTDWLLLGTVAALVLFGLIMVYSAGPKFALAIDVSPDYFLGRQVIFAILGAGLAVGMSFINYHILRRISVLMILFTIIMLILTLAVGINTLGAVRSLFEGSVRPSELAKLAVIIYVSVWLNSKRETLNEMMFGIIPLSFILGITGGLIVIQPDLSAAFTVVILGGILFFLAGGELRQIILVTFVALLLGWVVINVSDTGKQRVTDYVNALHDPLQGSYHLERSFEAVINGGIFGVGIGNSRTKYTGLPVAPTDSIFAVITEETGLVGAGLLIVAYLVILWRGMVIARSAPDMLGTLLASGMTIWIILEAFINMAVMVGLAPQAGNALPFISYGGSSIVTTLFGVGVLFSVARTSSGKQDSGGKFFNAVVDLRWRDRRGRVSRTGRTSDPR